MRGLAYKRTPVKNPKSTILNPRRSSVQYLDNDEIGKGGQRVARSRSSSVISRDTDEGDMSRLNSVAGREGSSGQPGRRRMDSITCSGKAPRNPDTKPKCQSSEDWRGIRTDCHAHGSALERANPQMPKYETLDLEVLPGSGFNSSFLLPGSDEHAAYMLEGPASAPRPRRTRVAKSDDVNKEAPVVKNPWGKLKYV